MAIDDAMLGAFMNKIVTDLGAAMSASLVLLGARLGLYKAVAGAGPLTAAHLARRSGTNERYVREWLCAQAAAGYVEYDATTDRFTFPDEHAFALAQEDSPA